MRESEVEKYLRTTLELTGGRCDKFTVPGRRNVPDRLCTIPGVPMFLVEVKASGKRPNDGQWREIYRFRSLGVHVYVVDNLLTAREILRRELSKCIVRLVAFEEWPRQEWCI